MDTLGQLREEHSQLEERLAAYQTRCSKRREDIFRRIGFIVGRTKLKCPDCKKESAARTWGFAQFLIDGDQSIMEFCWAICPACETEHDIEAGDMDLAKLEALSLEADRQGVGLQYVFHKYEERTYRPPKPIEMPGPEMTGMGEVV